MPRYKKENTMNTYSALHVTKLADDKIQHQDFNYKYLITNGATSHTAFKTDKGFNEWLAERGLTLKTPLTHNPEKHETSFIKEGFKTQYHMDAAEFYALDYVIKSRTLSNGDYVEAIITEDKDGIRTVHTLNPNVKDRKVFEYKYR